MSTNRVYVSVNFILHEEYCAELVFSYEVVQYMYYVCIDMNKHMYRYNAHCKCLLFANLGVSFLALRN